MVSENLIASSATGSTTTTIMVPFVPGKPYTVSAKLIGQATSYLQIYTKTAKGKTTLKRQTGPGPLVHRFIPAKGVIGLVFELKGPAARWEEADLREGQVLPDATPTPPAVRVPVHGKVSVGCNLAWGSFGGESNVIGRDYGYLDSRWVAWTAACGWKVVRIDFKAHRLFAYSGGPFRRYDEWLAGKEVPSKVDIVQLKRLVRDLSSIPTLETIILDNHGYGYHASSLIGSAGYPIDNFVAEWGLIAREMKEFPKVAFGLMNEPKTGSNAEIMLTGCLGAIPAIREHHDGMILVPRPSGYAGAQSASKDYALMERLMPVDKRWSWEVHWYADKDNSGITNIDDESCVQDVHAQLTSVTEWARRTNSRLFLGEYGVGSTPKCLAHIRTLLNFMQDNSDSWVGLTWWEAGMGTPLIRHIGPKARQTPMPQELVLKEFL